jgi:hypothetical protein
MPGSGGLVRVRLGTPRCRSIFIHSHLRSPLGMGSRHNTIDIESVRVRGMDDGFEPRDEKSVLAEVL